MRSSLRGPSDEAVRRQRATEPEGVPGAEAVGLTSYRPGEGRGVAAVHQERHAGEVGLTGRRDRDAACRRCQPGDQALSLGLVTGADLLCQQLAERQLVLVRAPVVPAA